MTHAAALEPLATHFGPLKITYSSRVLAPRPWTIAQSYWASEVAAWAPPGPILELHCGAGHIGLAAAHLSGRELVQIDCEPVACELARLNADRAGRGEQVEVRVATLPRGLLDDERFPIIIADPPYVPTAEVELHPCDPVGTIDGGSDGLDGARACLDLAARHLVDRGLFIIQLGTPEQAHMVATTATGLEVVGTRCIDGAGVLLGLQRRQPASADVEAPTNSGSD